MKEDKMFLLSTFLAIVAFMVVIYYSSAVVLEKRYQNALALIHEDKWFQAEQALKMVSNYKDTEILKRYVWAHIKLETNDKNQLSKNHYAPVLEYLNEIPESYPGDFNEEISQFRNYILQKSNLHYKFIYDYPGTPIDQLNSVNINGRRLYLEDELTEQIHNGLMT